MNGIALLITLLTHLLIHLLITLLNIRGEQDSYTEWCERWIAGLSSPLTDMHRQVRVAEFRTRVE